VILSIEIERADPGRCDDVVLDTAWMTCVWSFVVAGTVGWKLLRPQFT
jgi:hypothetical protein